VRAGKVRYIACSNLETWRVADAFGSRDTASWKLHRYADGVQPAESLCGKGRDSRSRTLWPGIIPYYPLASGLLTGKYSAGAAAQGRLKDNSCAWGDAYLTERNLGIVGALEAFCRERGHSLARACGQLARAQSTVASVICGATGPEQVEQNVNAAGWLLSAED